MQIPNKEKIQEMFSHDAQEKCRTKVKIGMYILCIIIFTRNFLSLTYSQLVKSIWPLRKEGLLYIDTRGNSDDRGFVNSNFYP